MKVDLIIPVYRPDKTLRLLLQKLQEQTFVVHKVILANTGEAFWQEYLKKEFHTMEEADLFFKGLPFAVEVFHVSPEEFDHGGTRCLAVAKSDAPYFICMTQDALPVDEYLVEHLLKPFMADPVIGADPVIAAVYARQLPKADCSLLEAYTRSFNYPDTSVCKGKEDLPKLGIKTYFCSNVCAAYRRDLWDALGGFPKQSIFNEDMIYAGHAVSAGYGIYYQAEAEVLHSHNYSPMEQFHRNFDLAVSQVDHPEVFQGVPSESEGIRMVKQTMVHLCKIGKPWYIPSLVIQSGCKYLGYRMGKKYRKLSKEKIRKIYHEPCVLEPDLEVEMRMK